MKQPIPLATRFNTGRNRKLSSENLVNMYAEAARGLSAGDVILQSAPVPKLFANVAPAAKPRGAIRAAGVHAVIMGTGLYTVVPSTRVATYRGLVEGTKKCDLTFDGTTVTIVSDMRSYYFNPVTAVFDELTDPDILFAISCASIDEYTLLVNANTGQFQYSVLGDGTNYDGLSFVAAETSPDKLKAVRVAQQEVIGFGEDSIEFFRNVGDPAQIFQRSTSAAPIEVGLVSRDSIGIADNSFFWVGRDRNSNGLIVYRAAGYQAARISNHAVEALLELAPDVSEIDGLVYTRQGHTFYELTVPNMFTIVYDVAAKEWWQRAQGLWDGQTTKLPLSDGGIRSLSRAGKTDAGEANLVPVVAKDDGNLYELSFDTYADTGRPNTVIPGASYTIVTEDRLRRVVRAHSGNMTDTLPIAGSVGFEAGKEFILRAEGGSDTITPATSTINGAATLVIPNGSEYRIVSDGSNYQAFPYTLIGVTREVTFPPIVAPDNKYLELAGFEIRCKTGVGDDWGDADPQAEFLVSFDGGETFKSQGQASLGRAGELEKVVQWRHNMGRGRQIVPRVRTTSACDFSIMAAWAWITEGQAT